MVDPLDFGATTDVEGRNPSFGISYSQEDSVSMPLEDARKVWPALTAFVLGTDLDPLEVLARALEQTRHNKDGGHFEGCAWMARAEACNCWRRDAAQLVDGR